MYNIYIKLTTGNRTTTGIIYKELYDRKCDPMTLPTNKLYSPAFKFLYIFWPDDGVHRPKLVAII